MLGPLDHRELIDAGVPPDAIGILKGQYPLTFTRSSLPPGEFDRPALNYFEIYAATRPATILETSGTTKRSAFHYRLGYVAFNTPASRWHAQWESQIEGFSLYIQPEVMDKIVEETFGESPDQVEWRPLLGDYVPSIAYLALDIGSQATAGYPAGVEFVEMQVKTLLSMIARRYSTSKNRDTSLVGIHSAAVMRAIQYVEKHLKDDMALGNITDAAAASAPHLNRLFRAELGVSVWAYVQNRRFEAIRSQLVANDVDPDKVAKAYGYASITSLNNLHKRKYGTKIYPADDRQHS